ncbi:Autoinducer 2-binding protein LsrB precursor [Phycisphaerae bacterium RAS1]|nr:Autoinducer 2-binding protein LsrB precursor [Phycisphaerae bacterium RAS1]
MRFVSTCVVAAMAAGVSFAQQPARKLVIGMVAKSQANPVFQAAYAGAKDAAKELGPQFGVEVRIDWQTPADEDAQKQAEAIETLARGGAAAIIVSCTDANTVTPAIDKAVQLGIPVMTFDSDAPRSKRLCCYGSEDELCGRKIMQELAAAMGEKGTIAILAGNQTAPNLQKRVKGVKEELKKYPNMKLLSDGVFYHPETAEQSVEAINAAQTTHPEIQGWAMVGGWPLFTKDAIKWKAGTVKMVAVDALPSQLSYLESGHVDVLWAQDCYGWGYKSVETLLRKVVKNEDPKEPMMVDQLTKVTKANAAEFRKKWDKWLAK